MSLEGSQLPAEARMGQLMARIDNLSGDNSLSGHGSTSASGSQSTPENFRAMVSMMQSQMYADALVSNDKDSDNSMGSMMGMGMNPMMMQGMMGGGMNPQVMAQMMQAGMMGESNPMMAMMGMGMNPMMNQAVMANMMPNTQNTQANYSPVAMLGSELNTTNVLMPVQGRISSEYGHRHHPMSGHDHFHSGVDIAAARGTPIRMPWEGKVVYVGNVQGFGPNTVIVAHENQTQADGKIVYSVFGHNDNVFVSKGQVLNQGEILGTVGSEGNSTGPHLHWETRVAEPGLSGTEVFNKHLSMTVNPMSFA